MFARRGGIRTDSSSNPLCCFLMTMALYSSFLLILTTSTRTITVAKNTVTTTAKTKNKAKENHGDFHEIRRRLQGLGPGAGVGGQHMNSGGIAGVIGARGTAGGNLGDTIEEEGEGQPYGRLGPGAGVGGQHIPNEVLGDLPGIIGAKGEETGGNHLGGEIEGEKEQLSAGPEDTIVVMESYADANGGVMSKFNKIAFIILGTIAGIGLCSMFVKRTFSNRKKKTNRRGPIDTSLSDFNLTTTAHQQFNDPVMWSSSSFSAYDDFMDDLVDSIKSTKNKLSSITESITKTMGGKVITIDESNFDESQSSTSSNPKVMSFEESFGDQYGGVGLLESLRVRGFGGRGGNRKDNETNPNKNNTGETTGLSGSL